MARTPTTSRPRAIRSDEVSRSDPASWVSRHGDALFRFAMARLGDRQAAEDTVQETLLAALRARERFEGRASERTWLIGILRRKVADTVRAAVRSCPRSAEGSADDVVDALFEDRRWRTRPAAWPAEPDAGLERDEFRQALEGCLASLPTGMGRAFHLREVSQLAAREVCEILNITAPHLSTLLYRARARLRRCLESNWFHRGRDAP